MGKKKNERLAERGITLIALVITIIILIILATIAIRGAVGDNGLVGWAKEARDKTKQGEEDEDKAMSDLDKYIEDQTSDSGVVINISKTPETEKTEVVFLKVESVEGIEGNIDFNNVDISTLTEEEKKNMVKLIEFYDYINYSNDEKLTDEKLTCFDELLKYVNMTEEEFWNELLNYYGGNIDNYLQEKIDLSKQNEIQKLNNYIIVNPDGNILDYQKVLENGTYTFTVTEITTGKKYTKSVQVSNIDKNVKYYYVYNDIYGKIYGEIGHVFLLDKNDNPTTFEEAYIIYNGERININNCIEENNGINSVNIHDVAVYLQDIGVVTDMNTELLETIQKFEIIKDGKSYFGDVAMIWAR